MKSSLIVAIVFWVLIFISLLAEEVFLYSWTRTGAYHLSTSIVYALFLFGWFLADARERGHTPSLPLKIAVVAVGVLALPYYKFRFFGARAGFVFIGIVLGLFVATLAGSYLVQWIIY